MLGYSKNSWVLNNLYLEEIIFPYKTSAFKSVDQSIKAERYKNKSNRSRIWISGAKRLVFESKSGNLCSLNNDLSLKINK